MTTLEDILDDTEIDSLPDLWQWREDDLKNFSNDKTLFKFQQNALINAIKVLWLYYGQENQNDGERLRKLYCDNDLEKSIDNFGENRTGFWMATGSGKTLVIVKLIELLTLLGTRGNIPKHDIMFLVYRENLLKQFKTHIAEYNASNPSKKINLINLQEYEETKARLITDNINVFYYRADLFIKGDSTAKKINPANCDNNGKWYVLLDEAHRGDSNDSKLQKIYSDFSRNGFMFNFSATFTDDIDLDTCAYNFNLEKFIDDGYGKKIYVSEQDIEGFREIDEFSEPEKQRVVLKTLILQTYIKNHLNEIRKIKDGLYHNPLLLTIVNSVNSSNKILGKEKPDLQLFFTELEKIAKGSIDEFSKAKENLIEEMETAKYIFGSEQIKIDTDLIKRIEYEHVLKAIFNTATSGKIEVIRTKGNSQEIAFKMATSNRPFALIKIGDATKWMRDILHGYEITDKYSNESPFNNINDDSSDINILMGSRTFYEGWDSNRPNLILFVNIGLGNSKKFVLQSIGRGVRIEPIENKRKRIRQLANANEIDETISAKITTFASSALESLFVFGTNAENLKKVIESLKEKKYNFKNLFDVAKVNPQAKDRLLLVPKYKASGKPLSDSQTSYPITADDLDSTKKFFANLDDKILLVKYKSTPKIIKNTKEKVKTMRHYKEDRSISNPSFIAGRLMDYYNLEGKAFDEFTKIDGEITHFKQIQLSGTPEEYNELKNKIMIMTKNSKVELRKAYGKIDVEEYNKISDKFNSAVEFKEVSIKHLANHYYNPLLVTTGEKVTYLKHIIRVKSERKFINALENQIDILDKAFDWWMFSKLDDSLDKVFIPYYNRTQNKISEFHPDFIFWFEKDGQYSILFIDPKGAGRADYQYKVDGFDKVFGAVGAEKQFTEHGKNIKVYLRLFTDDKNKVSEGYINYWIDTIEGITSI